MIIRSIPKIFLLGLFLTWNPLPAYAITSLTVSAQSTGTGGEIISGEAFFSFVDYDFGSGEVEALQIMLTNTSPTTSFRGNLLTGIFFTVDDLNNGTDYNSSLNFDGLAATLRTSNTESITNVDIAPAVNNTATDGGYLAKEGPFGVANSGDDFSDYGFGIATVGMSLVGSGNVLEGDNYGIAAAGSDLTLDGLPGSLPYVDTTATFWIRWQGDTQNLDGLDPKNIVFTYGSLPDNIAVVPEPATVLLLGSGLIGLFLLGWRRGQR